MHGTPEEPARIEVWVAMAEHFLDTDTRPDIPPTALRCLEAQLTVAEARDVWRYEVSRAVGFNAWDMVGEWMGWDREWLIERTQRLRRRWDNLPGTLRWLRYRIRVHFVHSVWIAIERCMDVLVTYRERTDREQAAQDLTELARHYFDFCPTDTSTLGDGALARLRALYPDPFRYVFAPLLDKGEIAVGDERLRAALGSRT